MKTFHLSILLLFATASSFAEMRTWTGKNGQSFVGELVSASGNEAKLQGENGKIISVPVSGLAEEDQQYIALNRPLKITMELDTREKDGSKTDYNPHVLLKYLDAEKIQKLLDLYVFLFNEKGQFFNEECIQNIRFDNNSKKASVNFESLSFNKTKLCQMLALLVDPADQIIAYKGSDPWFENAENREQLLHQARFFQLLNAEQSKPAGVLKGKIYNLQLNRNGERENPGTGGGNGPEQSIRKVAEAFALLHNFDLQQLDAYGRTASPIEASGIYLPTMSIIETRQVLKMDRKNDDYRIANSHQPDILFHLRGRIAYNTDVIFRFVCRSTGIFGVGLDNTCVIYSRFNASAPRLAFSALPTDKAEMAQSDWITMKAGEPMKFDVAMVPFRHDGEILCNALLFVEIQGVDYPLDPQGLPVLPLFATSRPSDELLTHLYGGISPGIAPPEPILFKCSPAED